MYYDFIEIGTSDFDTLVEKSTEDAVGICVEPVSYYLNRLPDRKNVRKVHAALGLTSGFDTVYYLPDEQIKEKGWPEWLRGCNTLGAPHPLALDYSSAFKAEQNVRVYNWIDFIVKYSIDSVGILKLDTEGSDLVLVKDYHRLCTLKTALFPAEVIFETNSHYTRQEISDTINLWVASGYTIEYTDLNADTKLRRG